MTTALDTYTWTPIGEQFLPPEQRVKFVERLEGVKWLPAEGKHPFSPAYGVNEIIKQFDIRTVVAITYNLAWRMPEKTTQRYEDMPYLGEQVVDAQILGVQTRLGQQMWFIDQGHQIIPIALSTPE